MRIQAARRSSIFLVFFALLATALLALTACSSEPAADNNSGAKDNAKPGAARTLEQIKQAGTIKLGVFSDKAPFGYVDAQGNYAGYDVEYGKRLAQDLGVKAEFIPVEAASRVEFLESGKVDVILANFTVTPERKEKVDFANPYMKVALGVVSPEGKEIKSADQLKDKKVIVVKGTTAEAYLTKTHPEVKLTKFEQYTEATNALIDGRGDAWVTDNTEALAWTGATKGFITSITDLGEKDTIAPAVQKGNTTVLQAINDNLTALGKENFFHQNFDKTLKPVYGDDVNADDLVVEGGKL
ncbi:transporter substrate-binding domain-containing protein [Corynebacterium epidermidicanis]|uniref:CjaA protein n=1 Tax=Corynebacterium epidermidicanis TaxID=1050174 RepID=A0A0G3GR09_9CORY|nr:transporter substrate-binding domain-containing protein [Corynebacterium epidermidicanis]AKK02013.1 CjaA protein [Corynebacterium epidermidicanis]